MNLQKINNNTVVPALVLRGCRREGRAALPRPRGAESLGFGAVSVLTRSSVARGGLTTPHISHPGVSRAGYPALPGRPQAPAPAGAAPCPRPSPGDCGMGNSGPFLILTYPRPPIHPLPKAAVCAGRPGAMLGAASPMDPVCARPRAPTQPQLCVCVPVSRCRAPPPPGGSALPGQPRVSRPAPGSASTGNGRRDIPGCPSSSPRVCPRTSEARSVIFRTGETLPNCYLQPHNNPLK